MVEYNLDQNWYKPVCEQCPYFVITIWPQTTKPFKVEYLIDTAEAEKEEEQKTARCERSFSEPCLAESFLVQRQVMLQRLTQAVMLKRY